MRKFSKHMPEQIVVKLAKAEALRGEGMSVAQACRVLGIGEAALCRWCQRYGSMSRSEAKELRELRAHSVAGPYVKHETTLTPSDSNQMETLQNDVQITPITRLSDAEQQ